MLVLKSRVPWKPAIALASVARIAEKALVLHSVAAAAARIIIFRGLIPHPSCWMFGAPCCACSFLAAPLWLLPLHLRKKHRPHLPSTVSLSPTQPKHHATHRGQAKGGGFGDAIGAGRRKRNYPRGLSSIDHGRKKALRNSWA